MSRRAVVALGLAGMLAWAGAAEAGGAWVLWGFPNGQLYEKNATAGTMELMPGRLPDPWVEEAFPTFQECQRRASSGAEQVQVTYGPRQVVWMAARYTCLPDTVDPRAPKAR
jgi:hypothetical protein